MDQEQQTRRAQAYESIFRSEHFEEAFQTVRGKLLEEFERSKPAEELKRERIHLSLTLLKLLQASIGEAIANGELSRRQIAAINGDKKGLRDFFEI